MRCRCVDPGGNGPWHGVFGWTDRCGVSVVARGAACGCDRQALSSSLPALPRSCLACAAWSFLRDRWTPAPCAGRGWLWVLRSQKPGAHRAWRKPGKSLGCPMVAGRLGGGVKGMRVDFSKTQYVTKGAANPGDKIYRVWGDGAGPNGRSWSRTDPRTVENYRDSAGLPNQNSGRFVTEGTLTNSKSRNRSWMTSGYRQEGVAVTLLEKEDQRVAAELQKAGIKVDGVYDLVNTRRSYKEAVPLLARPLPSVKDDRIKEGVVRALAVKEAVGEDVSRAMIREFEAISPSAPPSEQALKWAIANTLSVVARDSVFEKVAALASNKQHGKAREMLAVALGNMKDPRAVDVLLELLDDDEVARHALMALGKLKAEKAKLAIERFLDHPKPWVRKEAERALRKIEKARS